MSAEDTAEDDRRQLREKTQAIAETHEKIQLREGHCAPLSTNPHLVSGTVLSIAAERALQNNLGWTVGDDNTLTCHIPAGMLPKHKMSTDPAAVDKFFKDSDKVFTSSLWQSCVLSKERKKIAYTVDFYNTMVFRTLRRLENPDHLKSQGEVPTEYTEWQSKAYKDLGNSLSQGLPEKIMNKFFGAPQCNPESQHKFEFGKPVQGLPMRISTFTAKTLDNILAYKTATVAYYERKLEESLKLEPLNETEQEKVSKCKKLAQETLDNWLSNFKDTVSISNGGDLELESHFEVSKFKQEQSGKGDTHSTGQMYILGRDLHESALGALGNKFINPFQVHIQVDESTYNHNEAVLAEARTIVEHAKHKYPKHKYPDLDWAPTDAYYANHPSG